MFSDEQILLAMSAGKVDIMKILIRNTHTCHMIKQIHNIAIGHVLTYRVFIKYCVFFRQNVVIFLYSASSASALLFYQPFRGPSMKSGVHTEEKLREARVRNIQTQCLMNTLYVLHTNIDIYLDRSE